MSSNGELYCSLQVGEGSYIPLTVCAFYGSFLGLNGSVDKRIKFQISLALLCEPRDHVVTQPIIKIEI